MSTKIRGIGAVALAVLAGTAHGQDDAFWSNSNGGQWSTAASWSGGVVPNNNGDNTFNATLDNLKAGPYTVTLDIDVTVQNLSLLGSDVTLNLFDGNLTVIEDAIFANGVVNRQAKEPGAAAVNVDGSLTLTDVALMGAGTVRANGGLTIGGNTQTDICNTCVDNRSSAFLVGPGSLALNQNGELNNGDGSSFTIVADQNRSISGDGTGRFVNEGTLNTAISSRGGSGITNFSNVEFINTGTLNVFAGQVQLNTVNNLAPGQILSEGTWNVFDGSALFFNDNFFNKLDTELNISGANSNVSGITSLNEVLENGRFGILNGQNFTSSSTSGGFGNSGEIEVGLGSRFDVAGSGGLNNLDGDAIFGGKYIVAGTFITGADQIQLLEADLTLIGADSVFSGIQALNQVGSSGRFELAGGRDFDTFGNFGVDEGGLVKIGLGSTFEVTGNLVNNDGAGVFDAAAFNVLGTFVAQNLNILEISNELILDGLGSQLLDGNGNDAIANLQRIREDGILRLRNGRTLDNLDSLIVEGVLSIEGSAPESNGRGSGPGVVGVNGTITFASTSTLEIVINGAEDALYGKVRSGVTIVDGEATLSLIVNEGAGLALGDELMLIETGEMNGSFSNIVSAGFGDGLSFEVFQDSTGVFVRVVPAPGVGFALLGVGMFAGRRRR